MSNIVYIAASTDGYIADREGGLDWLYSIPIPDVVERLHQRGFANLYIDGGKTVQSFLIEDLIDEMIITRFPVLLGGGTPLFGVLQEALQFEHVRTQVLLNALVQTHLRRSR